ncbi:GDSL lipase/esterase [Mycena floridula]|nr:GDSL lipase/esterase [Mycena floridula]
MIFALVLLASVALAKIKHAVLFGDSYTDQSRQHSINNGSFPGKDYQEIYPPVDTAADGGFQWPFYLGQYGNLTISNYAVGGAVCNNSVTPLSGYPDVSSGQQQWFIEDFLGQHQKLLLDPSEFVVIIFIGTNDVGINQFITDDSQPNVSLVDLADCQLDSIRKLQKLGAQNFILNSLIPLQLTGLYANDSSPTIYWPLEHDGNAWNKRAFNFVQSLNRLLKDGVAVLNQEWSSGNRGIVSYFDTYAFFEEMYHNPVQYFNGSIPPNVTSHCHRCDTPTDFHFCGIGDCTLDQRDSFMWWDELHPSEQTGRNLAAEIVKKIAGRSKY